MLAEPSIHCVVLELSPQTNNPRENPDTAYVNFKVLGEQELHIIIVPTVSCDASQYNII
jgi:hypothetical protein